MPEPAAPLLRERIAAHIETLQSGLLERETAARLVLLATLAGAHVLLIGPPGTAKSELARRVHRSLAGARYFERLLTGFSTPEELFGPLSLKALEDDRYERLTEGFLPTAGIAFLDEVFKANSAILNALLTLLNEREFDNGSGRVAAPLISVVGASNELPADEALQAFHDRFLLRVPVAPVGDASFEALLALQAVQPAALAAITAEERSALAAAAAQVPLGTEAVAACRQLRAFLAERQLAISDRRWRQWVALMRTAAASEGRSTVDALDLWLTPYVAATQPQEVAALAHWFAADLLGAEPQQAPWLAHAVQAFEQQLDLEQRAQAASDEGQQTAGKLALAQRIGIADVESSGAASSGANSPGADPMQRVMSQQLEDHLRRRYSPVHVAARLAQLDEVLLDVSAHESTVAAQAARLAGQLQGRLWLPPALAAQLLGAHAQTAQTLRELHARLAACRAGFAALPLDDSLPAHTPAPVTLQAA